MTKTRGLSFGSREANDVMARLGMRGRIQNNNHQRHATAQGVSHAAAKHLARFRGLRVLHALSFAPQPNRSVKGTPTDTITLRQRQAGRPLLLALGPFAMPINFSAPIVAGIGAAGFQIGRRIEDYEADFAQARTIQYYEGLNLVQEVNQNTEILRIDGFGRDQGSCIYYGPDTVRLVFTISGVLACIYVWHGYAGAYNGTKIGAPLASVSQLVRPEQLPHAAIGDHSRRS